MKDLTELRIREKTLQGELANMRTRIEAAEKKIAPMRESRDRIKTELASCQQEIISALQAKVNAA